MVKLCNIYTWNDLFPPLAFFSLFLSSGSSSTSAQNWYNRILFEFLPTDSELSINTQENIV